MGNSGSSKPIPTPPPTPMPIEDDLAAKKNAAALAADRSSGASRAANDLNQDTASKAAAITRSQVTMADTLAPQAQPRGPRGPRAPRVAPGSSINSSAVITG